MLASEDFGLFGRVAPSVMFLFGAGEACPGLHNPDYDFPDELIGIGARCASFVDDARPQAQNARSG